MGVTVSAKTPNLRSITCNDGRLGLVRDPKIWCKFILGESHGYEEQQPYVVITLTRAKIEEQKNFKYTQRKNNIASKLP